MCLVALVNSQVGLVRIPAQEAGPVVVGKQVIMDCVDICVVWVAAVSRPT